MIKLISVKDKLPEEDEEVVVYFDHGHGVHGRDKALMYRKYDFWNFVGSNTTYKGKYIKYWIDDSEIEV